MSSIFTSFLFRKFNRFYSTFTVVNYKLLPLLTRSKVNSCLGQRMGSVSAEMDILKDFEKVMEGKANAVHPVTKYRSRSTGLEVVHADIEGPIVNGYIVLATKADDDSGLPHTLEHLVFMGSEDYPYKGVLDVLANKCFASGTNAWTDVDHTAYTLTTAGSAGFCSLLPIYMDHIFHPTLKDTAYVTEVHHTTGDGTDAGVVYCELQAKENSEEETVYKELVRTIYPPNSGYHWQTGGICKDVRDLCNNTRVREFHKKFYNPRNACIIVCGTVDPNELFKALEPTVKKLVSKGQSQEWTKPWLEDVPELEKEVEKQVKFPSEEDDEERLVTVGFRGPSAIKEVEHVAGLRLLFEYLTDSSVSPLQLAFVENNDPICSDVSYAEMENSRTTFYIEFEGVRKEKEKEVLRKLKATLEKQKDGKFDLKRMEDIIRKNYQEELSAMENTPHNSIAYAVIGDFLYGTDEVDVFNQRINQGKTIQGFLGKGKEFWTGMIKERILGQKWVTIYAHPSKETAAKLAKEDELRINDRRARLGTEGLTKMGYDLEQAILENGILAPASILERVEVPCASSIHSHKITRYANPDWASSLNCNFFLDDIKSNFLYLSIHLDTSSLTVDERRHLSLFKELLLESPVVSEDGKEIPFEEVVATLNRVWVSHGAGVGIDGGGRFKCGSFNHIFAVNAQMELEKVEEGLDWVKRVLFQSKFKEERVRQVAAKLAGDIPQMKRKGNRMSYTLLKDLLYKAESNVKTSSMLRQHKFLKSLKEKETVKVLEEVRKKILSPGKVTVHIATEVDKALGGKKERLGEILGKTLNPLGPEKEVRLANEVDRIWMKKGEELLKKPELKIVGNRTDDAGYLVKVSRGPENWDDPELAPLLVAMNYFCQTEGPFYRGIRGLGLAYGVFLDARCGEGLLYFNLYRCTDLVAAVKAAKDLIMDHLEGKEGWQEEYLTAAKSSLIFEYIEAEKTPLALSSSSLCYYYRNLPDGFSRIMIERILKVKLEDLEPIVKKYLEPLFNQDYALSIVAPQDKVVSVAEGYEKTFGKKLDVITSLANSFLEKWD